MPFEPFAELSQQGILHLDCREPCLKYSSWGRRNQLGHCGSCHQFVLDTTRAEGKGVKQSLTLPDLSMVLLLLAWTRVMLFPCHQEGQADCLKRCNSWNYETCCTCSLRSLMHCFRPDLLLFLYKSVTTSKISWLMCQRWYVHTCATCYGFSNHRIIL